MAQRKIQHETTVDQYTLGLVGPDQEWAGTVADGEIGRLPGVVQLNMLAPMDRLEDRGITPLLRDHAL
jgi:hypothetical protein